MVYIVRKCNGLIAYCLKKCDGIYVYLYGDRYFYEYIDDDIPDLMSTY